MPHSLSTNLLDAEPRKTRWLIKYICACAEPRILRMAPRTHARGGVLCTVCFRPFEPDGEGS